MKSSVAEQRTSIGASLRDENIEIYNRRTFIQLPAQALLQMLRSQVGGQSGKE